MNQSQRNVMWVASYPKSGNTWMRAFLANYLIDRPAGQSLPLTELSKMTMGDSSVHKISELTGRDPRELNPQECFVARHSYIEKIGEMPTPTFVKTHMPNAAMFGIPIIPSELSRCAVYIARNPLDVLISYSHYMSISLEAAAEKLGSDTAILGSSAKEKQLPQFLGSWSMHVRSWQAIKAFPVLYLRYEDMIEDPERSFTRMLESVGAPVDQARLRDTIEVTSFRKLQAQEATEGFSERLKQERFFRQGTKGQWQDILPQSMVDKVIADHGEVMRELGYL